MADKQPHLNGAYYGPSVPPPQPPQPHYRRDRNCCCCLFGFFWKLLLALIVIGGLAVLIFWLVVQPRGFKFYVSDAQLTRFDLPSDNNLRYDLVLNFTARNPNKKLSIYYDRVEARAFYDDQRFATADVITHMNSFRQSTKSSDPMSAYFSGQHLMVSDSGDLLTQYNEEKTKGAFNVDVKLYFRIRFKLGDVISGDYHPRVKCELSLPLTSNTTSPAIAFESTKCDVDF
ncbi:hypothetical protein K1719_006804 [Acacia pycnantha]|nr:hypothetical protein K1719_006804 [Acacia pycnantha]